jgi:IS30 family transposase
LALHNKKIKARRNQVASLLSKSFNETEIAQQLGVDQSTISRDIKVLKESAQQFVYDLAKSDLAYYYKRCIDGIEVRRKAWQILRSNSLSEKDKLLALKLIKECDESKFALFKDGPSIMNVKSLEERLNKIEIAGQISQ